jgi:hypothetical protein
MPKYLLLIVCFAISDPSIAQVDTTAQWAWMTGDAVIFEYPHYGEPGKPSKENTPGARKESLSWMDESGNYWIMGGTGINQALEQSVLNDLWKYDPVSNIWTWISGDSIGNIPASYGIRGVADKMNNPGSRNGSPCWKDPTGNFWLYGGGLSIANDLWRYEPGLNRWTWMQGDSINTGINYGQKGVPTLSNSPGGRLGSAYWTDNTGDLWLFGGNGTLNDLWRFHPSSNQWTWISGDSIAGVPSTYGTMGLPTANNKPGGRERSLAWADRGGNLWLFGGYNNQSVRWPSGFYNDLWKYNIVTNAWTWMSGDSAIDVADVHTDKGVASALNKPGARMNGLTWVNKSGKLCLFGGLAYTGWVDGNFWSYDGQTNQWTWEGAGTSIYGDQGISHPDNSPGGRFGGNATVDSSGNVWIFGGNINGSTLDGGISYNRDFRNDLWKLNGLTGQWAWMKGGNTPSASFYGENDYGTKGVPDPGNNPGAKSNVAWWADLSDNLWSFGGINNNDLWRYQPGSNLWTWMKGAGNDDPLPVYGTLGIASENNNPPERQNAMTWRDQQGNLWLFGGLRSVYYENYNDLWKYNPSSNMWTWVKGDSTTNVNGVYGTKGVPSASNNPGARISSAYWTDLSGNFWLYGGDGYVSGRSVHLNDLWKYSPTTNMWTWVSGDNIEFPAAVFGQKGVAAAANQPGPRYRSTSWADQQGNFWLFGGEVGLNIPGGGVNYAHLNDVWKYNVATAQWVWLKGDSSNYKDGIFIDRQPTRGTKGVPSDLNDPGPGTGRTGCVDKAGNFLLFRATFGDDLWNFNPLTNQWTWLLGDSIARSAHYGNKGFLAPDNTPGWRYSSNMICDSKGNCWLFGGTSGNDDYQLYNHNDLWLLFGSVLNYTTKANGNWNDPATWTGNLVPPASANVTIRHQVTINVDATVNNMKIEQPGSVNVDPGIQVSILPTPVSFPPAFQGRKQQP